MPVLSPLSPCRPARPYLRSTTALVALSLALSLGLPSALPAQENPPVTAAPAPAAPVVDLTAEWVPVSRLGFEFEMPAALPVEEDNPGYYAVSSLDRERTEGAYLGIQLMNTRQFTDLPDTGAPEFLAFLQQLTRIEMAATGARLRVGDYLLAEYRGSGVDGEGIAREATVYVSQELVEGQALLIGVMSAGIGGAVTGALEERFLTSLGAEAVPAEAAAEEPVAEEPAAEDPASEEDSPSESAGEESDGAETEPVGDGAAETAEPSAPAVIAEAAPEAVSAPDVETDAAEASPAPESGPESGTEAAIAEASPDPEPETVLETEGADAAGTGAESETEAEPDAVAAATDAPETDAPGTDTAASEGAPLEAEPMLAEQVSLALPEGAMVAHRNENARVTEFFLADAATPDIRHSRIVAGVLDREIDRQLRRMLEGLDALVEREIDGQPVWVVYGPAARNLADEAVGADAAIPARVVVPRFCLDGAPPFVVAMLAAPGDEARLDALEAGLRLTPPAGASQCDASVMDSVRAALPAVEAPSATAERETPPVFVPMEVPAEWQTASHFGLTYAVPPGLTLHRERLERDEMEVWYHRLDAENVPQVEVLMRIFTPEGLADHRHQFPDEPGFAEMLSGYANVPVLDSGETLSVGDLRLRLLRGDGMREVDGRLRHVRVLYGVAEEPVDGLIPWLAVQSTEQSPEAAEMLERAFFSSLGGRPEAPEAAPMPQPEIPMPPPSRLPPQDDGAKPEDSATPPAAPPAAESSVAMSEARAWEAAQQANTAEAMLAYLAEYPRGLHSGEARGWLHARDIYAPDERRPDPVPAMPEAPAGLQMPSDIEAWQIAMADGRAEGIWTYLKAYPQGQFAQVARTLLPGLTGGYAPAAPAAPAAPMPGQPDPRPMK